MDPRIGGLPAPRPEYLEPEFERLSRDDLDALQLRLFKRDLERVWSGNTFFRRFYEAAGFRPELVRTLDDIRRVPIVRKQDILADAAANPPYGDRLQVPRSEVVQVVESSGTTGYEREVQALTVEDLALVRRAKTFQFFWPGARKGTVVALHIPITMTAGALWSVEALEALGASPLRLGNMSAPERARYMRRYDVEIMQASTSYITRLEHAAAEGGLDLQRDFPRLRSIYVGGGGWTDRWARERAAAWNARLYEVYASSQRVFAYTCEWGILDGSRRGILHFVDHLLLAEVIDPRTGERARDGEEGEVVFTPFGMTASPLIRYGTNDRVRYRDPRGCPCGRAFHGLEAGSVARYDDMLRVKEMNVWPETIDGIVFGRPEAIEYRGEVYVDDSGREIARLAVELRPETSGDARQATLDDIASAIHRRVGIRFIVDEWRGPSLVDGATGIAGDFFKTNRRWSDRRGETREPRG